ncbi:NADH dehydrogenase [ubiquinone] 1 alpha subcomplex subunit 12-like [Saccostrea echinata]|uniref:NADH dehydrogenase [ubiquinone] 1 alpha subcomplex subunit 12-like n=1 Tax=Saccostrea echinata TaxID=191078 RepID=UPI002A7F95FB|nr:NADH dehydrogenase [ubiquinone] 1 alpha subcomplex subunit 12-like [Saccostrea echinata]
MPTALESFARLRAIIQANGGILNSLRIAWVTDDLKIGTLKGVDKFGNRYYENNRYFFGKNRWVRFADRANFNYDGSQIPPEWHRWMHYMTDETPVEKPLTQRKWMMEHEQNPSGTKDEYVPYSTTRTKIESWTPPQNN